MLRSCGKWTLGVLALVLGVAGCGDSDSFMPPPIPELDRPAPAPAVKVVELILPAERTADRRLLAQLVRLLASRERVSFRVAAPASEEPASKQAELIHKAVSGGASALIVDPASDPEVGKALDEARARKVPVVLLGRSDSESAKSVPLVEMASYDVTADKLVEALVEDGKTAKVPDDRTAAIMTVRDADTSVQACVAAFETAFKKANVTLSEPLTFDGTLEGATKALKDRLEADPKLALVLVTDQVGFTSVLDVRDKLETKRPIVVAGYLHQNPGLNELHYSQTAAMVFRDIPSLANAAFQAAIRLIGGETVAERTEVPDEFRRFTSKYVDAPTDPAAHPGNPAEPE